MPISRRNALAFLAASSITLSGRFGARLARAEQNPEIGLIDDIVNIAWATLAGAASRSEIEMEDLVIANQTIETEDESAVVILFADGSSLSMGENSAITIDSFVYDPATSTGNSALTLTRGAFRYVSGSMARESYALQTPTVTIGIRGTELLFTVEDDGGTECSVIEGEAECVSRISGRALRVLRRQSVKAGRDGVWQDGVRNFVHQTRSRAIEEGLDAVRRVWRIRKRHRPRRRRNRN
ncbi:MAG TPA: FecR family protein [Micropepsaceae bacterium]|nr:FecR family protein [Micropepsaceae bacterium]